MGAVDGSMQRRNMGWGVHNIYIYNGKYCVYIYIHMYIYTHIQHVDINIYIYINYMSYIKHILYVPNTTKYYIEKT